MILLLLKIKGLSPSVKGLEPFIQATPKTCFYGGVGRILTYISFVRFNANSRQR